MPKLRFDRFMVSEHTNRIFSQDKEPTVSETSRIYFVDNSYGFTHDVSEYDTKLNLQDKTYEISKEQRHQMDPAGLTIASHIQNQVPIITPFMTVSEYMSQKKYPLNVSQPADINATFRPLLTLIQNNKQCVFEEQLDLNKCQVYYDLMV